MTTAGEISVSLKLDSDKFCKDIDDVTKQVDDLSDTLETSKEKFSDMNQAMKDTEKPAQKVAEITKSTTDTSKEMIEALKDISVGLHELKTVVKEGQGGFINLDKSLINIKETIEKNNQPMEKATQNLEKSGKEAREVSEIYGDLVYAIAGGKDFKDLSHAVSEAQEKLRSLALQGAQNSTSYKELAQKAKEAKAKIADINKEVDKAIGIGDTPSQMPYAGLTNSLNQLIKGYIGLKGVQIAANAVMRSDEAFKVQKRAILSLNTSMYNAGVYTTEYSNHLQKLSAEIQSFSNYGDEAVEKAIGLGQAYSGNIELTDDLIKATVDYAAATETDLQTAFTLVGKSIGTSTNALARYGVSLDDSMSKEQKMEAITKTLSQRFNGSAKDMADTATQLKNATGDLSEAFGKALNPAVEKTQNILIQGAQKLTNWINKVRVLKSEINSLESIEDLTLRAQENVKRMNDLIGQSGDYKAAEAFRRENQGIYEKIRKLKEQQKQLADDSKNNFVPMETEGTGKKTSKSTQDKALEAYKKYVEEYAKINDDYAATLKARQYVEGTLNIDPVTQKEEYDKMVALYQAHLSKMAEIRRSGTKNQAEIERLEEEKLAQDLQTLRLDKERETRQKLQEIIKGYQDTTVSIDTSNMGYANSFLGGLSSQYKAKLDLEKWYQDERKRIIEESNNDLQLQTEAFAQLDNLRTAKLAQADLSTWEDYGRSVSDIMTGTYTNLITGQENFADAMKNMAKNMLLQLLQMLTQYVMKEMIIRAASMFLGGIGAGGASSIVSGGASLLSGGGMAIASVNPGIGPIARMDYTDMLPKYHSGGFIPGTKEQLAVLKGGERVLNPAENLSYTNDEGAEDKGVNIVNVFNIKAFDGKDVINTLKANAQTINQITASGIKNNQQGLRTAVQNV